MRIGDLDALFLQLWRKADPFKEQPLAKPSAVWSEAATLAREAPTIDPEALPIVRQLREELERVTAEMDAAMKDIEQAITIYRDVEGWDILCRFCNGKSCRNDGECKPEWRGPQKEE